ncbi:putative RDD family membrane protein YckC [Cellulomonas soli]|uniref:RDD family protein n=1 Tax=Cellulomonas soli TaxID=931535 RepID=UPI0016623A84|nr:RDD family protein [Cellulomonas soli]NYI58020.1 putative RDD family membrane protein YckC [Cellulomonas soli]
MPAAPAPATGYACSACGRPLRAGARFCSTCGEPAPVAPAAPIELPVGLPSVGLRAEPTAPVAAVERSRPEGLGPAFDGTVPAGTGRRLGAFALDTLGVLLLALVVLLGTRSGWLAAVAGIELAVGFVVWEARTGLTPGNLVLGLRTSREESPYSLGTRRAAPRALLLAAGHLVLGLGQWALVATTATDPGRRQGWHDRLAKAVVVDVRGLRIDDEPTGDLPGAGLALPAPSGAHPVVRVGSAVPASQVRSVSAGVDPLGGPPPPGVPGPPPLPVPEQPAPSGLRPVRGVQNPHPAVAVYVLTLDTGEALSVTGTGLIGRNPRALAGDPCDHLVTIDDPGRSLSRTHARFGIDAGGFWVSDAGSGNGTSLTAPGHARMVVPPGQRVPVPSGSTVHLGERTFTVHAVS